MCYMTLSSQKTTNSENNSFMTHFFYSVPTFARIRQHYFSKYADAWAVPHLKFLGGPSPPVPPRSPPLGIRTVLAKTNCVPYASSPKDNYLLKWKYPLMAFMDRKWAVRPTWYNGRQREGTIVPIDGIHGYQKATASFICALYIMHIIRMRHVSLFVERSLRSAEFESSNKVYFLISLLVNEFEPPLIVGDLE